MTDESICPRCGCGVLVQDNQTHVFSCTSCNFNWKRNSQGEIEPIDLPTTTGSTATFISNGDSNKPTSESIMTTPEEKTITIDVPEKDKPFILALIGSGMTILFGLLSAINVGVIDPVSAKAIFETTLPLTASAWGYYFAKKNNGSA